MTIAAEQQDLALNAELSNDDIEALLSDAPEFANQMGLVADLEVPADQLWQQVKLNDQGGQCTCC